MSLQSKDDLVTAIVFTFSNQPTSLAPTFSTPEGGAMPALRVDDPVHDRLQEQVRDGFAYLQAMFHLEVDFRTVRTEYEAENDEEKNEIGVFKFSWDGKDIPPLNLSFDLLSRAMMAAEEPRSGLHRLFATLHNSAREAHSQDRFIDSFRYAFLIFDALFSEGHSKRVEVKRKFGSNPKFVFALEKAVRDFKFDDTRTKTESGIFLRTKPAVRDLIHHLVERRGHYFHSNREKGEVWNPDKQDEARELSFFCLTVLLELGSSFAEPLFDDRWEERHASAAKKSGAIIMVQIDYISQMPGEKPSRARVNVEVPGTKVTRYMATEAARFFLTTFSEEFPGGSVLHAIGRNAATATPIFEIKFPSDLPS